MELSSLRRGPVPERPRGSSPRRARLREHPATRAGHGDRRARASSSSTSTITTTTRASARINLVVADASSTGEILRDLLRGARRGHDPRHRRGAVHRARHRHRALPVPNTTPKTLRLAAELVEAGANVHRVFQGVYENVAFAKLKLLATSARERSRPRGRASHRLAAPASRDFADAGAEEPFSEGIIDHLRAVEGTDVVALIREPPTWTARHAASACGRRAEDIDVSVDRAQERRRRPPAGGRLLERGVGRRGSWSSSAASTWPRSDGLGLTPRQRGRETNRRRRPGSCSSTSLRARRRSRWSGASASAWAARSVTRARSTRSRAGSCSCCSGRRRGSPDTWSGSTSGTSPRWSSVGGRRPATQRATSSTVPALPDDLDAALAALTGEVELRVPAASAVKVDGERAYRLHRRGVAVEMPVRR